MAYVDQQLPQHLSVGAQRIDSEPGLNRVRLDNGVVVRNQRHSQSTMRWRINIRPYRNDSATHLAIVAQFKATRGGEHSFPFKSCDPDHSVLTAEPIGTGDGVVTAFQVTKTWTVDGQSQTRYVTRPETPLQVFKDAVLQGAGYTVDYDTGIVTFAVAPGIGVLVSVTGTFVIPVMFTDEMVSRGLANFLEEFETIELEEDRAA